MSATDIPGTTTNTAANVATTPFFVTGGTMPADAASYIERQADNDLYQTLKRGELCYVLNARQMGKSSLCVRTIQRLKADGVHTVFLDLTKFGGSNLTPEQWYASLTVATGRELDLRREFLQFFKQNEQSGPMERFFSALRELVLTRFEGNIVVFVDEIDVTRSLPFKTDEFFAGIRECYTARATEPALSRLTFCLLGTATPADLIEDARITPFNIGKRIELKDFTDKEAAPLAVRLPGGLATLKRVLFWTGGHPYLTQTLCLAVQETKREVNTLATEMFLSHSARESESNLTLVRDRLLRADVDQFALLSLYRQVLRGKKVADDDTNPLCDVLKLSGVVTVEKGLLRVRNEIYRRVFDDGWVEKHLPGVEVRRQKAAFVRGLVIAGAIAGVVLCIIGSLAYVAQTQANIARMNADIARKETARANDQTALAKDNAQRADTRTKEATDALTEARKQRELAEKKVQEAADNLALANRRLAEANAAKMAEGIAKNEAIARAEEARRSAEKAERASYTANMNLIQFKWDENNIGRVLELLEETKNYKDRGFEWGYWNRLCHLDLMTFRGQRGFINAIAFSPDNQRIVTGSQNGTIKVWSIVRGQELLSLRAHNRAVTSISFSSDGQHIITGSDDKTAKIWNAVTGRELLTLRGHSNAVNSVAFSIDGKRVATSSTNCEIRIWDAETGKHSLTLTWQQEMESFGDVRVNTSIATVAFSPDGKYVKAINAKGSKAWDANSGKPRETSFSPIHGGLSFSTYSYAFDERRTVSFYRDNTAKISYVWDDIDGFILKGNIGMVTSAVFSQDGKYVATGCTDGTVKVWDATNTREYLEYFGKDDNPKPTNMASFGRHTIASYGNNIARVYDKSTGNAILTLKGHSEPVCSGAFSPDGKRIITGSHDSTAILWDATNGLELFRLKGHKGSVSSVTFSSDGKRIVTGSDNGVVMVWDAINGKELLTLNKRRFGINSVVFSSDGKRIVTRGDGRTTNVSFSDIEDANRVFAARSKNGLP